MKRKISAIIIILTGIFSVSASAALLDGFFSSSDSALSPGASTSSAPGNALDSLNMQFIIEPRDPAAAFYQLETQVMHRPSPLMMDGRAYLIYEIFISNVGKQAFYIDRVDILNGDRPDQVIASYGRDTLLDMIQSFQRDPDSEQSLLMKPGVREVFYFMPRFGNRGAIPQKLIHRFVFRAAGSGGDSKAGVLPMHAATTVIDGSSPVIIGAPLQGDHWLAANGPSNTSVHRRSHITNHGIMFFPKRYAIDFMRLGPNGMLFQGDSSKNESYFGYGANVYAVATGTVVSLLDGVPDNSPGGRDNPVSLMNLAGNYVLLDMGKQRYALYAHLSPQSITVKKGDVVQKGQLIGHLGNSGNSEVPHLHFQITDRPSILSTQGIPYSFELFATEGYKVPNPDADEPRVIFNKKPVARKNELVRENAVLNFPEK